MSTQYPPQGAPQGPYGQSPFAQQSPAPYPPGYSGYASRNPVGGGLPSQKRIIALSTLGVGLLVGLLALFLPYVSVSAGYVSESVSMSDVPESNTFVFTLIFLIAVGVSLALFFLRLPPASLFGTGGVAAVAGVLFLILWFKDFNDLQKYGGSSVSGGIGFWFYLLSALTLLAGGALVIAFMVMKRSTPVVPNFAGPGGPVPSGLPQPGFPGAQPGFGGQPGAPGAPQPGYGPPSAQSAPAPGGYGSQPYGGNPYGQPSASSAPTSGAYGQPPAQGTQPGQPSGYASPIAPQTPQYPGQQYLGQ